MNLEEIWWGRDPGVSDTYADSSPVSPDHGGSAVRYCQDFADVDPPLDIGGSAYNIFET